MKKKVLVAVPCGQDIPLETFNSFMQLEHEGSIRMMSGSLVDDAREQIALDAIAQGFDYVMWIDSDMTFEPDSVKKLLADDKEVVCGLCFRRVEPYTPAIYRDVDGKFICMVDYEKDNLIEVDGCGTAFLLTSVKALKEVYDEYHTMFKRAYPLGEDLSFCKRYKGLKDKHIYCDTRVKIGHIGKMIITEKTFEVVKQKYEFGQT